MSDPAAGGDRFARIRDAMIAFRNAREWKQFHDPKNLAEGLSIEAAELLEVFQWKTTEESRAMITDEAAVAQVSEEVADCFLYCILMADSFGIDLIRAAEQKLLRNGEKYPVEKSRGRREKYDAL
ncbi:MAG: nucleotide pyrophosphohydrolase [Phycisphaerales bacterium]|nr:nucleotide pyrophosphohydrolase [Phycisphaerales bacterium]